jgi:GTP-binding protein
MARRPPTPNARRRVKRDPAAPYPYARKDEGAEGFDPRLRVHAEFLLSAPSLAETPPDTGREVAFAGRSNAGKSSVLNRLTGQKSLARTGRTPGRTQALNFFRAGDERFLVDLPGYGYAKTDRQLQADWQAHVEAYLAQRQALVGVVLVMDIRHPFQAFDRQLLRWAGQAALPVLVLLNKADKLGHEAQLEVARAAEAETAAYPTVIPVLFSALRGQGAVPVLRALREWLNLPLPDDGPAPEA